MHCKMSFSSTLNSSQNKHQNKTFTSLWKPYFYVIMRSRGEDNEYNEIYKKQSGIVKA